MIVISFDNQAPPQMNGQLRGHERLWDLFHQASNRQRLAHAYLFVGPEGIGKRRFAEELAQRIFCHRSSAENWRPCGLCSACVQMQAGTHPDLIRLARPEGKRELPVELLVGSPERRGREGLCHDLSLRPMAADRRIAIVDDAQTMNAASANALLKTLEEPPPGSMLILLTPSLDAILPTIRSRCQPITFTPLTENDVAELLLELAWASDPQVAQDTARLAGGSLSVAQQLLQPVLRNLREKLFAVLGTQSLDAYRMTESVLAGIDELGGDPATQRLHASWAIRFCAEFMRLRLRELAGSPAESSPDADRTAIDSLAAQLERCLDAEIQLQRSMPIPLCLEGLFDGLSRLRRGAVEAGI